MRHWNTITWKFDNPIVQTEICARHDAGAQWEMPDDESQAVADFLYNLSGIKGTETRVVAQDSVSEEYPIRIDTTASSTEILQELTPLIMRCVELNDRERTFA